MCWEAWLKDARSLEFLKIVLPIKRFSESVGKESLNPAPKRCMSINGRPSLYWNCLFFLVFAETSRKFMVSLWTAMINPKNRQIDINHFSEFYCVFLLNSNHSRSQFIPTVAQKNWNVKSFYQKTDEYSLQYNSLERKQTFKKYSSFQGLI